MRRIIYFVFLVPILFQSCSSERIKGKTWEGKLYRQSDNRELSEVKLKISGDSLYLFANAIFGADNDTLVLVKANRQDSICTYRSVNGAEYGISLKYSVSRSVEILYIPVYIRNPKAWQSM